MNQHHLLSGRLLCGFVTVFLSLAALPAMSGDSLGSTEHGALRVEIVQPTPRPLTEPRRGPAPLPTVGDNRDVIADANKAVADPVSPESRAHLDALIREFRQR